MIAKRGTQRISLETLRGRISDAIAAHFKSYNVPSFCIRQGLAPGEADEAFRSKRLYVNNRLQDLKESELISIATNILKEVADAALADIVSEMTVHAEHRITDITRRDVLKNLNGLYPLFGDVNLFDGLNLISEQHLSDDGIEIDNYFDFLPSLAKEIKQHYMRNDDFSNEELLIRCGALTCSQTRFFALIEKLLDPVVRRGEDQAHLANKLNVVLKADGFNAMIVAEQSGYPIYAVHRIATGVTGTPKNLIFASINAKPDLYFTDAINNDIAIRNKTDALIYDRFLTDSGLLWITMVEWWQQREGINERREAQGSLYRRLMLSVRKASSVGEYTLFDTYYREFSKLLGDQLPALIPQVYLHYDPRTMNERNGDPVLLRQRMDMLLLLANNIRIVIEVDGKQHYADGDKALPSKYAKMVSEDRRLRLAGYELYRFSGAEFQDTTLNDGQYIIGPTAKKVANDFFQELFKKHNIKPIP
jgi:AbiJ N-terminal domain 3